MNFMQDPKIYQPSNLWGKQLIGMDTTVGAFSDIGDNVIIGTGCKIQCHVSIPPMTQIGNNVFIGPGVRIANDPKMDGSLVGTLIKDGAKIGMGALIQGGITIGENVIIGMGAIVTKDVPDGETWYNNCQAEKMSYKINKL